MPITRERDPDDASRLSAPSTQPIPLPTLTGAAPEATPTDEPGAQEPDPQGPGAQEREPERGPLAAYGPPGFPLVTPFPEFPQTPEPEPGATSGPVSTPGPGLGPAPAPAGGSLTTPALAPLRPSGGVAWLRRVAGACAGLAVVGVVATLGIAASTPQRVVLLTGDAEAAGTAQVTVVPLRAPRPPAAAGLRVRDVEAAVRPADLPSGCPAAAVAVQTPPVPLDVPADPAGPAGPASDLEVPVSVGLRAEEAAACRRGTLHVDGVVTVVDTTGRVLRLPAGGVLAPTG